MNIRGIDAPGNALRGPVQNQVEIVTPATPDAVYRALANVAGHLDWAGERSPKSMRLLTMDAPPGFATIGTEFVSTGADPNGTFVDRSVVTEASRGRVFEFVTEAVLTPRRGGTPVEWTLVHRYEIVPSDTGARVTYCFRVTRISRLIGPLRLLRTPVAGVLRMMWRALARRGLRNLTGVAATRG